MVAKRLVATTVVTVLLATMSASLLVENNTTAYADTYTDLITARSRKNESSQRERQLREQLNGVSAKLADQIIKLDDLTNNQIPAAQSQVDNANAKAADAQAQAQSATSRLDAARKDMENLKASIAKNGADYDDARATIAQVARSEFHGSNSSDVMSVVTGSKTTQQFVDAMQSRAALSRNESAIANDAAVNLGNAKNRQQRLEEIEQRIAVLQQEAQSAAASAQSAATSAQQNRDRLESLRQQGESMRKSLESQKSSIASQAAQQAMQTILLQSQVDSYNQQYQAQQAKAAANRAAIAAQNQGTYQRPAQPARVTPPPVSANAGSTAGQGTGNGDYGNRYVGGQCTYWAYERRKQMGISTPSFLGNGGQWWQTAPGYGLRVDHNPQVGAAVSFLPGQAYADGFYGHVAVVESVNGDTITISEMNAQGGPWRVSYRTLSGAHQFWYVH